MACRDRTSKFISYRDLNFAGSLYRRRAARRNRLGGGGAKPRTRTSRSRDYVAVTIGDVDEESDEGAPVWTEFRDHVNNSIHEIEQLLSDLKDMHRSELGGFGIDNVQQKSEDLATQVTAKIKDAEHGIKMVLPKSKRNVKSASAEDVVRSVTLFDARCYYWYCPLQIHWPCYAFPGQEKHSNGFEPKTVQSHNAVSQAAEAIHS